MKLLICIIFTFFLVAVVGQDVNFGINLGTNPYNRFKFENDENLYTPKNSFYTYASENEGSLIIFDEHKLFNTIHFGLSARISRKKIGLNIEPQFLLEYVRFKFKTPYDSKRILSRKGYRIPIYLTYHLFNNPLAVHLNAGIIVSESVYHDYQQPDVPFYYSVDEPYTTSVDHGNNHLYEIFYDEPSLTLDYMLGLGKRINKFNYNLRYVSALNSGDLRGVRWQIEFNLNFYFLSKQELFTKNYLYEE